MRAWRNCKEKYSHSRRAPLTLVTLHRESPPNIAYLGLRWFWYIWSNRKLLIDFTLAGRNVKEEHVVVT